MRFQPVALFIQIVLNVPSVQICISVNETAFWVFSCATRTPFYLTDEVKKFLKNSVMNIKSVNEFCKRTTKKKKEKK